MCQDFIETDEHEMIADRNVGHLGLKSLDAAHNSSGAYSSDWFISNFHVLGKCFREFLLEGFLRNY